MQGRPVRKWQGQGLESRLWTTISSPLPGAEKADAQPEGWKLRSNAESFRASGSGLGPDPGHGDAPSVTPQPDGGTRIGPPRSPRPGTNNSHVNSWLNDCL